MQVDSHQLPTCMAFAHKVPPSSNGREHPPVSTQCQPTAGVPRGAEAPLLHCIRARRHHTISQRPFDGQSVGQFDRFECGEGSVHPVADGFEVYNGEGSNGFGRVVNGGEIGEPEVGATLARPPGGRQGVRHAPDSRLLSSSGRSSPALFKSSGAERLSEKP